MLVLGDLKRIVEEMSKEYGDMVEVKLNYTDLDEDDIELEMSERWSRENTPFLWTQSYEDGQEEEDEEEEDE